MTASSCSIAILIVLPSPSYDSQRVGESPAQPHTFTGLSPAQTSQIEDSLELFEQANLDLPGIDFIAYDDRTQCNAKDGLTLRHDHRSEIRICSKKTGPWEKRIAIHEIAHAWDHHTLGDAEREAFLSIRRAKGWREGEWVERGEEQAAEIITWGISDEPIGALWIDEKSCAELLAGYLALTGEQPLHGFTDVRGLFVGR